MEKICKALKKYQKENKERLAQICTKLKKFKSKKEKMMLRGFNDFNYISLLKGFYNENTHSKIIAEFLNPRGSHYQGTLFLENFFKTFNILSSENLHNWQVFTEWFIENCENKGQGRIDILLKNSDQYIIIENKINADDQDAQIYKYVKCIEKKEIDYGNIEVIYLSVDAHNPSDSSLANFKISNDGYLVEGNKKIAKFRIISYEKILEWMERNLKDIENISSLREAIKQYIKAVKVLLKREENIMNLQEYLMRDENRKILIEMIENYCKLPEIVDEKCQKIIEEENVLNVLDDIAKELRRGLVEKIKNIIFEKLRDRFVIKDLSFGGKYAPLTIYKPYWKKCENNDLPLLHYALALDKWEYRGIYYGIRKCAENIPYKKNNVPDSLRKILTITGSRTNPMWLSWKWFEYPYSFDRISLKEKNNVRFYTELLRSYDDKDNDNIDNFVVRHYVNPFMEYVDQTEKILDMFYQEQKMENS